LVLTCTGME